MRQRTFGDSLGGYVLSTWSRAKQIVSLVFTHLCVSDLGYMRRGLAQWICQVCVGDTLTHNPFLNQFLVRVRYQGQDSRNKLTFIGACDKWETGILVLLSQAWVPTVLSLGPVAVRHQVVHLLYVEGAQSRVVTLSPLPPGCSHMQSFSKAFWGPS